MNQKVTNLNAADAEKFMSGLRPQDYSLLDVRQPWEYEEFHLPGATLIPLPELPERIDELNSDNPVLAYCRSGGRSMAASRILALEGMGPIYNLVGGASAWLGHGAYGPENLGIVHFNGVETAAETVVRAYVLEEVLKGFYLKRADNEDDPESRDFLEELAGFEEKHEDVLFELYLRLNSDSSREDFEKQVSAVDQSLGEGGVDVEAFYLEYGQDFIGLEGIVMLALSFEAQAYDYYMRCSRMDTEPDIQDIFLLLAREELAHLRILGKRMDRFGK